MQIERNVTGRYRNRVATLMLLAVDGTDNYRNSIYSYIKSAGGNYCFLTECQKVGKIRCRWRYLIQMFVI